MVLIDTSIWIAHLRSGSNRLERMLLDGLVVIHPYSIGELACGNIKDRHKVLDLLRELPQAPVADPTEVFQFTDAHHLWGKGLGWIDVHLLASAKLLNAPLWTADKALRTSARALRVEYDH
jgi:predicted nucleic acid-binding protein